MIKQRLQVVFGDGKNDKKLDIYNRKKVLKKIAEIYLIILKPETCA